MASITLDLTGKGGLVHRYGGDINRTVSTPNLRYIADEDQMAEGIYNPFDRFGYMSPLNGTFQTMTTPTLSTGFSSSLIDVEDRKIYFAEQDEKIYEQENNFTDSTINYTYDPFDPVKFVETYDSGGGIIYDLEVYQINGNKKLFFARANNVGIADDGFASADATWLTGTASGAFTMNGVADGYGIFMRKADNGYMYIFDSYSVHKVDGTTAGGTNGTVTQNVLVFPKTIKMMDAIDYRGNLYIGINDSNFGFPNDNKEGFVGVYVWDRLSTVVRLRDFIQIPDAKEVRRVWIGPKGDLRVMTIGSNNLTQIRKFNGSSFDIIFELTKTAYVPRPDALVAAEGFTFWAAVDGYIYGVGVAQNSTKEGIFKLAQYSSSAVDDTEGVVLVYAGQASFTADSGYRTDRSSLILAYSLDGGAKAIKKWYIHGTGTITDNNGASGEAFLSPLSLVANQGNVYTPVKYLPTLSTLKHINIYCVPGGATGTDTVATIKFYANQSTTAFMTKTVTRTDISKGYLSFELNKPFVNAFQMEIEWDTTQTLGSNDFAPSVAILEFEPTNTLK